MGSDEARSGNKCILSTWCAPRLGLLFFIGLTTTLPADAIARRQQLLRFDHDVGLFAQEKAREKQGIMDWCDLWFNHTENRKRGLNRAFQAQVEIGDMEFGTPQIKPESIKVEHLYEATFEGGTRSSSLMEITQTKKITKSNTLETFWGFESNSTSTIEAGIPLILKITFGYGLEVIIHKVKTEVSRTTEEVSLAMNVTIPPRKIVKVTWLATKVTTDVPWTVKVKISGHFVVEFKDSNVGRHQQVFSVGDLPDYFPELKKIDKDTVEYISKGVLSIEQADKLTVKVREEPVSQGK
ncbi:uncharacterized protein LOC144148952 [Haemaphysalis longicornis]